LKQVTFFAFRAIKGKKGGYDMELKSFGQIAMEYIRADFQAKRKADKTLTVLELASRMVMQKDVVYKYIGHEKAGYNNPSVDFVARYCEAVDENIPDFLLAIGNEIVKQEKEYLRQRIKVNKKISSENAKKIRNKSK
jgi:hypothetical protein